jgi:hypothetical protein
VAADKRMTYGIYFYHEPMQVQNADESENKKN